MAGINTAILLSSSLTIHWALVSIKNGNRFGLRAGMLTTFLLGLTFLTVQINEYVHIGFAPHDAAQGTIFYALTGLHGAHVLIGLLMLLMVTIRAFRGHYSAEHHMGMEVPRIYWHFVDVMWVVVYTTVYVIRRRPPAWCLEASHSAFFVAMRSRSPDTRLAAHEAPAESPAVGGGCVRVPHLGGRGRGRDRGHRADRPVALSVYAGAAGGVLGRLGAGGPSAAWHHGSSMPTFAVAPCSRSDCRSWCCSAGCPTGFAPAAWLRPGGRWRAGGRCASPRDWSCSRSP